MKLFDRHQQYNLVKHCLALDDITGSCIVYTVNTESSADADKVQAS